VLSSGDLAQTVYLWPDGRWWAAEPPCTRSLPQAEQMGLAL
jgi:hypothetical protein